MRSYSIGEAKTNLSQLIAAAERGEPVEIRRGRTPVARLVPVAPASKPVRKPGALKGKIKVADDFDSWPDDIAKALGIVD
ncbi:MAG: type II toxin-antitoxin system prevent-host-death family antitoxin [Solirubrobacterales bacterium]|nr:type II toxin-antitoxin system prevent-host-death family antitoxin [Solirubrobacterales bacterium]